MVMDETRGRLEQIYEEHRDEAAGHNYLPSIVEALEVPDWQENALLEAYQVDAAFGEQYIQELGLFSQAG